MNVEQVETTEGLVLRSSPTPAEWQRTRVRLAVAAGLCALAGAGLSVLELTAGVRLLAVELLPLAIGLAWASRFMRTFQHARPTAVVATDHSLRLERLDGSRNEELDLGGIGAIRIGPDGFAIPWRWMKGPQSGLVVLRLRTNGRGLAIPPQLASHPVTRQLLARMLATSRSTGPVNLVGPKPVVDELEALARAGTVMVHSDIPPITIPAGWYDDPAGSGGQRWWDGREWTAHTR